MQTTRCPTPATRLSGARRAQAPESGGHAGPGEQARGTGRSSLLEHAHSVWGAQVTEAGPRGRVIRPKSSCRSEDGRGPAPATSPAQGPQRHGRRGTRPSPPPGPLHPPRPKAHASLGSGQLAALPAVCKAVGSSAGTKRPAPSVAEFHAHCSLRGAKTAAGSHRCVAGPGGQQRGGARGWRLGQVRGKDDGYREADHRGASCRRPSEPNDDGAACQSDSGLGTSEGSVQQGGLRQPRCLSALPHGAGFGRLKRG